MNMGNKEDSKENKTKKIATEVAIKTTTEIIKMIKVAPKDPGEPNFVPEYPKKRKKEIK